MRVEQRLALRRQLAEAVGDLFEQRVDLLCFLGGREPLVQDEPRMHVAAVGIGQQRRRMQVDLGGRAQRRQQVGLRPAFSARTASASISL